MKTVRIEEFRGHAGEEVLVRGWVHNKRSSGKLQFLIVRDGSGFAQAVVNHLRHLSGHPDRQSFARRVERRDDVEGFQRRRAVAMNF